MTLSKAMHNQDYFTNLNYTLANEDTSLEVSMLKEGVSKVVSIAGSGSRVLPLLARHPKTVACIDVSTYQLALTEMRIEAARTLDFEDFALLLGYPHVPEDSEKRKQIFRRLNFSSEAKSYIGGVFEKTNWGSILYLGKWEQTFQKLSKLNRALTRESGRRLFEFDDLKEQVDYLESDFSKIRWLLVLLLIGNSSVFNSLLYSGDFPKKNIKQTFLDFYKTRFDHLFRTGLCRENYFLQLCFFGKLIYADGCPIEADRKIFSEAKRALHDGCEVSYCRGNVFDVFRSLKDIDFFSFSDVPSYFKGETEKQYLQWLRPSLSEGAMVVIRHYLHVTEDTDKSGFIDETSKHLEAIRLEKLAVYDVEVLSRA